MARISSIFLLLGALGIIILVFSWVMFAVDSAFWGGVIVAPARFRNLLFFEAIASVICLLIGLLAFAEHTANAELDDLFE